MSPTVPIRQLTFLQTSAILVGTVIGSGVFLSLRFLAFFYTWTAFPTSDKPTVSIVSLSAIAGLKVFSPLSRDALVARLLAAGMIAGFTWLHERSVRTGGCWRWRFNSLLSAGHSRHIRRAEFWRLRP